MVSEELNLFLEMLLILPTALSHRTTVRTADCGKRSGRRWILLQMVVCGILAVLGTFRQPKANTNQLRGVDPDTNVGMTGTGGPLREIKPGNFVSSSWGWQ